MKSVIQESSSLGKAIDLAWSKAGCPAEFSVKILQKPERGFLGLNSTAAKIVMFFDETKASSSQQQPNANRERKGKPHQRQRSVLNKDGRNQENRSQAPQRPAANTAKPNPNPNPNANANQPKETSTEETTQNKGPRRRNRWRKNNNKFRSDQKHSQGTQTHGDSEQQRTVKKD